MVKTSQDVNCTMFQINISPSFLVIIVLTNATEEILRLKSETGSTMKFMTLVKYSKSREGISHLVDDDVGRLKKECLEEELRNAPSIMQGSQNLTAIECYERIRKKYFITCNTATRAITNVGVFNKYRTHQEASPGIKLP
ncbi:hypothetical protein HELRODRAFT_158652 [Helobdella robusta]|uniref:Uncharacterized protein n=1 Tax=Helobdella robusta TaxID=6412 RepID=T1EN32_HELRO|nr:hypothetical protein HELRODRAFT_158652 [Helobdella robusta]ESO12189.1 hypothetical protein HELRODRAFT_158652 [Helobdella robusta]